MTPGNSIRIGRSVFMMILGVIILSSYVNAVNNYTQSFNNEAFDLSNVELNGYIEGNNTNYDNLTYLFEDNLGKWYAGYINMDSGGTMYRQNLQPSNQTPQLNVSAIMQNRGYAFLIDLPEGFILTNQTDIGFQYRSPNTAKVDFVWVWESGQCDIFCATANCEGLFGYLCSGHEYHQDTMGQTAVTNMTWNWVDWTGPAGKYPQNIKELIIVFWSDNVPANPVTFMFDEFYLGGYIGNYTQNELPEVQINYNSSIICLDLDSTEGQFEIDINATDPEGDTIYYSQDLNTINKKKLFYDEDFIYSVGGECQRDFSFLTSNYFYTNDTVADTKSQFNAWAYKTLVGVPLHTIEVDNYCNGYLINYLSGQNYGFDFNQNYGFDSTTRLDIGIPYNESYMDIVPTGLQGDLFNLTLNKSEDGELLIYIDNSLVYQDEIPSYWYQSNGYIIALKWTINNTGGKTDITIAVEDKDQMDTIHYQMNNTFSSYSGIKIGHKNTKPLMTHENFYFIRYLWVNGQNYEIVPTWTTTKPHIIPINNTTEKLFTLYVSDSIHIPNYYDTYEVLLNIEYNTEYCKAKETGEDVSIWDIPKYTFGEFIKQLGLQTTFQKALWALFIILLIGGIIQTKTITFPLLFASLVSFALAYTFGSVVQKASFVILLAGSIIFMVAKK